MTEFSWGVRVIVLRGEYAGERGTVSGPPIHEVVRVTMDIAVDDLFFLSELEHSSDREEYPLVNQ